MPLHFLILETILDVYKRQPHTRATSLALLVNELISNGVKHANKREERLTICMLLRREGDNYFFIYEDNGAGFPDGFEPWKSTGIGMTIMPVSYTHLDVYKRQPDV